jgi:hypothetical protein
LTFITMRRKKNSSPIHSFTLKSVRGDDGEMEAPAAILGEDATPLSTFKKNHKNRLTKIFKKGADPVPPPPPDYPNDDGRPMLSVVG